MTDSQFAVMPGFEAAYERLESAFRGSLTVEWAPKGKRIKVGLRASDSLAVQRHVLAIEPDKAIIWVTPPEVLPEHAVPVHIWLGFIHRLRELGAEVPRARIRELAEVERGQAQVPMEVSCRLAPALPGLDADGLTRLCVDFVYEAGNAIRESYGERPFDPPALA